MVQSGPPPTVVLPTPGIFYKLVSWGAENDVGVFLAPAKGTNSCCDEIRAGWMVMRGQHWVAVDTVAELLHPVPEATSIAAAGPFHVRVDSGFLALARQRNDWFLFRSVLAPRILPATASVGVRRGDTITVKSGDRDLYHEDRAELRVYVRVRPARP